MKKSKLILLIISIVILTIIIDTTQAIILKNSPIISFRENLSDYDSFVDKGILIDTFYCTKERDIVDVSWHFKTTKFTCPIDNEEELNELENVSMTIKDGSLTNKGATIIIHDTTNKDNTYGEFYRIDKWGDNKWQELDVIVEGNYGWNAIGYSVGDDNTLELKVNWEWLYGKLKKGEYRLVKEVNNKYFSANFIIR